MRDVDKILTLFNALFGEEPSIYIDDDPETVESILNDIGYVKNTDTIPDRQPSQWQTEVIEISSSDDEVTPKQSVHDSLQFPLFSNNSEVVGVIIVSARLKQLINYLIVDKSIHREFKGSKLKKRKEIDVPVLSEMAKVLPLNEYALLRKDVTDSLQAKKATKGEVNGYANFDAFYVAELVDKFMCALMRRCHYQSITARKILQLLQDFLAKQTGLKWDMRKKLKTKNTGTVIWDSVMQECRTINRVQTEPILNIDANNIIKFGVSVVDPLEKLDRYLTFRLDGDYNTSVGNSIPKVIQQPSSTNQAMINPPNQLPSKPITFNTNDKPNAPKIPTNTTNPSPVQVNTGKQINSIPNKQSNASKENMARNIFSNINV